MSQSKPEKEWALHSHCSYCGERFPAGAAWPRRCGGCGNRSYLNPLPVIVVLVPVGAGVVVVRRNIEPMQGELALPGGYLELGESWQEGARREVLEETGIDLADAGLTLYDLMNGLDGTLIVFALATVAPERKVAPFCCAETLEVLTLDRPAELAFEMHTKVVARYFEERGNGSAPDPAAGMKRG